MIFRQLFDKETSTYTYLLADEDTRKAVIIDPVIEQWERDAALIKELHLTLEYILDTHVHADHITGATYLKRAFPEAQYAVGKDAKLECADMHLEHGEKISMGSFSIETRNTPGHTDNSVSLYVAEEDMIFTGDALLIRGCGRTDFQSGDPAMLYDAIHSQIFTLPGKTKIYPAHDYKGHTVTTVTEEMESNPRLGGTTKEDFIQIMENLHLPYPQRIDVSLPGNNKCGDVPLDAATETVRQG